ncbi:MAG TPA: antitoxin MazE family protein [Ensifer sp.]|nr:antitoxin MazE family protein [Ensifer sp.]
MTAGSASKSSRAKVSEHRERLRAAGFRPLQIWVPDTRSAVFRAEALRQSRAVASSDQAKDDQAFIDAISEFSDE